MRNLKITLSYDGSEFYGWQVQPGLRTVQGTLAEALERLTGERVLPQGSGRTDAGVHALAQVASVSLASPIPIANLASALNDVLPPAVRVLAVEEAAPGFHARTSARAKTYCYRIYRGPTCPPFLARLVWPYPYRLDEQAIMDAAPLVEGDHDFTSFAAVDPERAVREAEAGSEKHDAKRSNVRTVFSSRWERHRLPISPFFSHWADDYELVYTVRGSGFLHHMVRNLVGTFVLIGKGRLTAPGLARILKTRDRAAAGPTAPPNGLYLVSVEY